MHALTKSLTAAALVFTVAPVNADIQSDLNNFFDSMGLDSNITSGGAYQGQSAGYYTGGSVFARAPSRNYQLASVQLPHFRAGCGGIDAFAGGFSFINSDQLVAMMKNVGSNAVGLAFQVALSTISPKMSGLLQDMQDMANEINSLNVNSCEAAANMLGSVLPKTEASQKALCQSIGTGQGIYGDYAQARQECGSGGDRASTLAAGRSDPRFKELTAEGNIVWRALMKVDSTSSDHELAELVMSLTGSVIYPIVTNDTTPVAPRFLAPTIRPDNNKQIQAFFNGGTISVWRCDTYDEFGCLSPDKQDKVVTTGYRTRINQMLTDIVAAMASDSGLTQPQLNLLNETSLPIYKMLNVATAYSPQYAAHWREVYAEAIALDLLYQYLKSLNEVVEDASSSLQLPDANVAQFQKMSEQTRVALERLRKDKTAEVDRTIQMMQESMMIERMLISSMSPGLANSVQWSKAMQ